MQYKVGEEYKLDEKPTICNQGFHYCKSMADCYRFYPMLNNTRICEVEPLGEVVADKDGIKFCTNHIKIVREIKNPREMSNVSKSSSGFFNSGNYNSGNWNSGSYNSGSYNSGNYNCGNWNSGDYNSGVFNTEINPKIRIFDKESNWTVVVIIKRD